MKKKIDYSRYDVEFDKNYIIPMSKIGDKERKMADCIYAVSSIEAVNDTYLVRAYAEGCQDSYFDIQYFDFLIHTGIIKRVDNQT